MMAAEPANGREVRSARCSKRQSVCARSVRICGRGARTHRHLDAAPSSTGFSAVQTAVSCPSFALKPSQVACSLALRGAMFTPDERGKHPCEGCGCTPFNNETGLREHLIRGKLCRKQRAIPWVPPTGDAATLCPLLDDPNAPERDYTFVVFGVQR